MGEVFGEIVKVLGGFAAAAVLYIILQLLVRAGKILNGKLIQSRTEAQAAGDTAKAAAFNFALTVVNAVTYSAVSKIESEKAYMLRKAVKAGEAQAEELKILSSEAYREIAAQIGSEVKACLDSSLDDTEQFLMNKIEELLPKAKADYLKTLPEEEKENGNAETVEG